jgi:hypothetical protein
MLIKVEYKQAKNFYHPQMTVRSIFFISNCKFIKTRKEATQVHSKYARENPSNQR